jgi:hypothetical protein
MYVREVLGLRMRGPSYPFPVHVYYVAQEQVLLLKSFPPRAEISALIL